MGRIILGLLALVLLVLAGTIGVIYFKGEELVRDAVETEAPPLLGADVKLGSLGFSPFAGKARLANLTIGNPQGFTTDQAFSLGEIKISMSPRSVLSDHIEIQEILIDQPVLTVELAKGGRTNIKALQENVAKNTQTAEETEETAATTPDVSIAKFTLTEATVRLQGDAVGIGDRTLTLKPIVLEQIGVREGGLPPGEAFRLVMEALSQQVQKAVVEEQGRKVLDKGVDKVLGEDTGGVDGLKDKAEDKLKDGLGSLLKKKKEEDGTDGN